MLKVDAPLRDAYSAAPAAESPPLSERSQLRSAQLRAHLTGSTVPSRCYLLRVHRFVTAEVWELGCLLVDQNTITDVLLFPNCVPVVIAGDPVGAEKGSLEESLKMAPVGRLKIEVLSASGLMAADFGGKSDPYVKLGLGLSTKSITEKSLQKSTCIKSTLNPVWNQSFTFDVYDRNLQVGGMAACTPSVGALCVRPNQQADLHVRAALLVGVCVVRRERLDEPSERKV